MLHRHTPLHAQTGYNTAVIPRCPEICRRSVLAAGELVAKMRWQAEEEPTDSDTILKELMKELSAEHKPPTHQTGQGPCSRKMSLPGAIPDRAISLWLDR